jgi:predicted XRE-type DNA-binding protein
LGVTCIYLLTEIPPFDLFDIANNTSIWREYLTTPVREHLAQTLTKIINPDLQQRWQSTSEIITTLGIKKPSSTFICVHLAVQKISPFNIILIAKFTP